MDKKEKDNQNHINIKLPEEVAEGTYVNLAMISHSNSEFVLDFVRVMPGVTEAKVKSRIIVTPEHTLRLFNALKDNLEKYQRSFGEIRLKNEPTDLLMNFGGVMGEA